MNHRFDLPAANAGSSASNGQRHHGDLMGTFGAGGMDGVWNFKDLQENSGDQAIADGVRHLLREDAATHRLDIEVMVRQGRVLLLGVAPRETAVLAETIASSVPGVSAVIDQLHAA